MDLAIILARQITVMFLLMGVGVALKKTARLSDKTVKELNNFLLLVVVSCSILNSFQGETSPELIRGFFVSLVLSVAANLIGVFVSLLMFGTKNIQQRLCVFGACFSNCAFMAFPLLSAIFSDIGLLYGAGYVAVFNIILWTFGVNLFEGAKNITVLARIKNIVTTPVIIVVVIGITMYSLGLRLPNIIGDSVRYLADLNTPLAMILLGVFVADCDFKTLLNDLSLIKTVAAKLILMPLAVLAFMKILTLFIPLDETLMLSILICAGSCTATTMALLAERYDKGLDFSVKTVTLSTVLCLVSLPVVVMIAQTVL